MRMHQVTYWFRPTDDHHAPSVEWLRQTGAAIAAAASAVLWDDADFHRRPCVEVCVGSVHRHPRLRRLITAEAVSFRAGHRETIDRIEHVLRQLGASRALTVIPEDPVADRSLAPFAFLYRRALLRFGWWGTDNEDTLRSFTGLRAFCTRNVDEDGRLLSAFGRENAAEVLATFVGEPS